MNEVSGLKVIVQGDLPTEIMERVGASVRKAVLSELADADLAPDLKETPLQPVQHGSEDLPGADFGIADIVIPILLGIWLRPEDEVLDPVTAVDQ